MIKNYVFDFGQTLVRFDPRYMTSVYVRKSEKIEQIASAVFDRLYFDKLDAGTITDEEVKRKICDRLPKELQDKACLVYDNWYYNLPIIDGIPELLKEIKDNGGRLFLLSNISCGFAENYNRIAGINELLSFFDGLVFSGEIRMVKPDKNIFEYLLNKYDLSAAECVFIDDNKNNTLTAESLGIKSILFDGNVSKLRFELI